MTKQKKHRENRAGRPSQQRGAIGKRPSADPTTIAAIDRILLRQNEELYRKKRLRKQALAEFQDMSADDEYPQVSQIAAYLEKYQSNIDLVHENVGPIQVGQRGSSGGCHLAMVVNER